MRIKTFSQYINESLIIEKAVSAEEVLANEPNTAIVKVESKKLGKLFMTLILFNFKENKVEGLIAAERFTSDEEFMITKAYAVDKHGPLMYELLLSVVSPRGIIPNRLIKPKAQSIWEYFDKKRPDVNKTELNSKHYWFTKEYDIDIEHEHLTDPEVLKLLNKSYSVTMPIKHTDALLEKGEKLMAEYKLKPADLIKQGEEDFYKQYNA